MIVVENQFALSFAIGGVTDFMTVNDLDEFTVVEEGGNSPPWFRLAATVDAIVMSKMTEQNDLEVSMGTTVDDLSTLKLYLVEAAFNPLDGRYQIAIEGLLAKPAYLVQSRTGIIPRTSSLAVIRKIAEKHFTFETNISATDDEQPWVQASQSDRAFLQDVWMRSYVAGSWTAVAISHVNDTLSFLDMGKVAKGEPKWRFMAVPQQNNDIQILPGVPVTSDAGFQSATRGYSPKLRTFDTQTSEDKEVSPEIGVMLAPRASIPRRKDVAGGSQPSGVVRNDNMHAHYYDALQTNSAHLRIFSGFGVSVDYNSGFRPMKVLDLAYLSDANSGPAAEFIAGNYFIAKIIRTFRGMNLTTRVHLTREAPGM
jgi:hypothetical protein